MTLIGRAAFPSIQNRLTFPARKSAFHEKLFAESARDTL